MHKISLLLTLFIYFGGPTFFLSAQDRPNVILIFTDDQGTLDLNCYGARDLHTPHLDRLAAEGVRFTQMYVGAPVCSPSRATLLTGKNPHAAGVPGNAPSQYGHPGMPPEQTTIAEVFRAAGYATGHVGKWHLGYDASTMPLAQGFDYSFGHMGGCIDNYSHFFYWDGPNRHDLWENGKEVHLAGQYFPDMMLEKAQGFIQAHQEEPFFLYYALNIPHYPLQPQQKWRDHYASLDMPRRDYAGFISTLDENIGALTQFLADRGLKENTVIVFLSDHGHSCETRTFGGGGYAGNFRGAKFSLFEGGIRVPAIIRFPAALPQGKVIDQLASSMDWLPTLASLAGIDGLPGEIEGHNLLPVIQQDAPSLHTTLYWKLGRQWAVRQGDWKLIGNPRDPSQKYPLDPEKDRFFLSNLSMDPSEAQNLADAYPEKVSDLTRLYQAWPYADPKDIPQIIPPVDHLAYQARIELTQPPHPKYQAQGPSTLVDRRLGSDEFTDGRWLGFEQANLEAVIDLGKVRKITTVSFRCLQDVRHYIFYPQAFSISYSEDGDTFFTPREEKETPPIDLRATQDIARFEARINAPARYIRVQATNMGSVPDWYPQGAGSKAWLFVDEVVVE